MWKIFYDCLNNCPKIPIKPTYGNIYPIRPDGTMIIIVDNDFEYVECYGVIILTGDNSGQFKFIKRREIVIEKGRKPTKDDIKHYRIKETYLFDAEHYRIKSTYLF